MTRLSSPTGGDIVVREIQKQAATGRRVSLEKKIIDFFCDRMVEAFRGSIRDQFDIFVGSLSSNADDLYQWRSYGDDGRGFILGFSAEAIGAASVYISPVSYGPEKATRVYETIAKKAVDIIVGNMDHIRADREGGYNFLRLLSVELSKPILTQSVCTKHPAYEREREVRLLVVKQSGDTSGVERRPHRNGADQLRFVRVKIPVRRSGSITGIVVGPDAHPDTEAALRQYLCHLGVGSEGIVTRSKVPYRSMQPRTPLYSCFMTP